MAESAVIFLLNKLSNLVETEFQLLNGVWQEIACLRGELERIRDLLKDADEVEETSDDQGLKVWIKQVREVTHDAEDVVDEFILVHAHHHLVGGEVLSGCLYKLSCCVKSLKSQYRIALQLQRVNGRIRDIYAAHKRLCLSFSVSLRGSCFTPSGETWHDRREDALFLADNDVVGIDKPKRQLVEWLINGGSEREVIGVTGMGGIGKTTLVKKVYDDFKVEKNFKIHAWITVSQPFNKNELLKDMIQNLSYVIKRAIPEGMENMNYEELITIIKNMLKERRYLIVFDDLWNLYEWEAVKYALPNSKNGSKVMITTRKDDVALNSCKDFKGKVYNLMPLSQDVSWELFCRKAFAGNPCPPYLFEICKDILRKCEGLPLAVVALSGVLAKKDTWRIDEWDMIRRCLGVEIQGNDKLEDLKKVLSLSLNDLPYYLKSCFLYLGIFPEGYLIKRMTLIRLWIAEGFIEAKEGRTLEEVAQDYLNDLLNRNLMQVAGMTTDRRVKFYRIHDLLREIIISKSRDQNFAVIVKEQTTTWPGRVRRLSIHTSLPNVQDIRLGSHLRSLFMFGVVEKSSLHTLFQGSFMLLRVLDFQRAPLKTFPVEVADMFYLKYLSLRKTKVKTIPRYIRKLQNLETLDLKKTCVTQLPIEILQLHKLRHLLVYHFKVESYADFYSKFGFKAASGNIGSLQSLQKLCFIEACHDCNMILRELGKLNQLRRLGIMKLRRQDGKVLCLSIERLKNLRSLSITSTEENEVIDLQQLSSPPQFLERLYLTGRLEELPSWIPSLHGLVRLFLKWSLLRDDPLVHLQDLPNLVHLELLQVYDGETLCFKAGKFKKLTLLGLDKFDKLKCVQVEEGALPCLEKLVIHRCNMLWSVPFGIEHLTKLKVLTFFDMPDKLIMKLQPDGNGEDHWKVKHVTEVYSAYWRDGSWDVYSIDSFRERQSKQPPGIVMGSHDLRTLWKV
ncbi:disease resistance protein RPM1 [Ziziphus jujuba]|uniref:Disease resistance protein RPM1 n=1 Tax=Ziziphus jujuba TaxID=326968 RepID=A0ABM3I2N4_ZIZJJ|nr:disease resistance protein RPM1 [Ziziphus jujuba]